RIGLRAVHAELDYGDPTLPEGVKHASFVFTGEDHDQEKFQVFMNSRHDLSYTYSVQYHFDPTSDWEGERFSYEIPPQRTEDRTLLLNPYESIGFLEVSVFPHRLDRGMVDST